MITRATAVKAVLFVILTVALVLYVGATFLGLFNFLGAKDYTVRLPLQNASGLFDRAEVTFRGVQVGAVGPLRLTDNGVEADLVIEGDAPKIPADLIALVASRSAVGEKYVDLRPNSDAGPFLADGALIPADRVQTPVPVENALTSLDQLVASVPLGDLRTTVNELGVAFNGLGPKLQLLLDSTHALTVTATENLPQTLTLIRDARTVLQTQNDLSSPIKSFSKDLKLVAEQLRDSDPDIRRLLETGPEAAEEVSQLIDEAGPGLSDTIRESLVLSRILRDHLRGIQTVLQTYPGLAAAIPTLLPGDGTAHLGLAINLNDPPNCYAGYEATEIRPGYDVTPPDPLNYRAYCRKPIFDPTDVRGVKPQYPFKNNQPQPPPDWYHAFYTDGPQAGIFGPPRGARKNGHHGDAHEPNPVLANGPGLLGAPASGGDFGLIPSALPGR